MNDVNKETPMASNGAGGTSEMERLFASAQDAMTDEMVARLGATFSNGLDLLDRFNRSGVGDALPTLSRMVKNGDIERVADLARLVASTQDALSDDIVARLAGTATNGLDLLDRINRSGIARALPAITQLVENGDLDRLVGFARLIASIEDSLSDDIVHRLAIVATGLASLVDKLARHEGFLRMIDVLGRDDVQASLVDFANAASAARAEAETLPRSSGGLGGLLRIATDPGTQDALRFMSIVSKHLRKGAPA